MSGLVALGVGLATPKVAGSAPGLELSDNNLWQVVHTRASVTKQSMGDDALRHTEHASHTSVVYPSTGSQPKKGK